MNPQAMKAAGVSLLMAVFWNTEAVSTLATGFLSMWTSNNSTTLMMLPIGLVILYREIEQVQSSLSLPQG